MGTAVCDSLSVYSDAAVCLVNVAAGIATAPNVALGPLVATFVWNCVALFETVSEGTLALWPGALSCWGSVPRRPAITRGTVCLPKPPASAGFQCGGWVVWKLAPRPLGQAQMLLLLGPWALLGLLSDGGKGKDVTKTFPIRSRGRGSESYLLQRPHLANGESKVQTGSNLPQIKSQAYIPTRR